MSALLLSLALLSACRKDAAGYCHDKIVHHDITSNSKANAVNAAVALGKVLSLSFPEDTQLARPPVLGNEAFYTVASDASRGLLVTVWPKLPKGAEALPATRLSEVSRSNLQLFLETGETVTVGLRIGKRGVEQLIFGAPEREIESAFLRRALAEQASRLKAQHLIDLEAAKAKAKEDLMLEIGTAFLSGEPDCTPTFDRSMDRFLIVTARTICRVGRFIVATFTMKNRAREDLFQLDKVEVLADDHEDTAPSVEARVIHEGGKDPLLRFGEEETAAAVFEVKEAWEAARQYQIRVREAGGKKRVVTVDAEF